MGVEEGDDEFRIAIDTCSSRFFYQGLTCFLRDSVDRNIGIHFPPYQKHPKCFIKTMDLIIIVIDDLFDVIKTRKLQDHGNSCPQF